MYGQVGLAGPSGSGKTAFSEKVRSFIPGITVLSMDNYNDASRLIDGNFDGAAPFTLSSCSGMHSQGSCNCSYPSSINVCICQPAGHTVVVPGTE